MLKLLLVSSAMMGLTHAQTSLQMFLTAEPKLPGRFYDPNDSVKQHYFKSVDDMDKICMDEAATKFPDPSQAHWEFLALACDSTQNDMLLKFPSFPNIPINNNAGNTIVNEVKEYFEDPLCPTCWTPVTGFPVDLVDDATVNIPGYEGSPDSLTVVRGTAHGRYFWHACDPSGKLETDQPSQDVNCRDWKDEFNSGYIEDVGVKTGTGSPGHRTASLACDVNFVHIMCLQVIGATPRPTPVELPLFIFKTNVAIYDDGNNLVIEPALSPPPGLVGSDLLDWVCNNDPSATPNLVSSGAGDQSHGPYLAVVCTDPAIPGIVPVDKQRFLTTKSTRNVKRWLSDPALRVDVAYDYTHYFNAMAGATQDGISLDCNDPSNQLINPVDVDSDPSVATGCDKDGTFGSSGDCNGFLGNSNAAGTGVDPYQIKHWDGSVTCDQFTATIDCTDQAKAMPFLCMELDQNRGLIRGDPHFISFSGGNYDVKGEAGGIYNIISDTHFQFNSEFVPGGRHATYMGSVALMFNNHTIWWKASLDDQIRNEKALMNGKKMHKNSPVYLMKGDKTYYAVMQKKTHKMAPRLEVKVPGYLLKFTYKHAPRRIYGRNMIEANRYRPHYFDFSVVRTYEPGHAFHPHGLLGQTARFSHPVKQTPNTHDGEGVIEGGVEEYRVPDMFSMDFKHNEYDPSFAWRSPKQ